MFIFTGMQYLGITNKIASEAKSADLVKAILQNVKPAVLQVQKGYANRFAVRSKKNGIILPGQTALKVWQYLRTNIRYKKDSPDAQRLFLPSAFTTLRTGDCKSYAIFTAAVLTALGIRNGFYFTSYKSKTKPSHVYNWIRTRNGKKIPVDGCFTKFGKMKIPSYIRSIAINEQTIIK